MRQIATSAVLQREHPLAQLACLIVPQRHDTSKSGSLPAARRAARSVVQRRRQRARAAIAARPERRVGQTVIVAREVVFRGAPAEPAARRIERVEERLDELATQDTTEVRHAREDVRRSSSVTDDRPPIPRTRAPPPAGV